MFDTEYVDHQAVMQKLQDFVYVSFHSASLHIKYADALYTFFFLQNSALDVHKFLNSFSTVVLVNRVCQRSFRLV